MPYLFLVITFIFKNIKVWSLLCSKLFQLKQNCILFTAARVCFPFYTKNRAKWGEELYFSISSDKCKVFLGCEGVFEELLWSEHPWHRLIPEYQNCVKCCLKPDRILILILKRFVRTLHLAQLLGPDERMAHPDPPFGVALGIHKSRAQHTRWTLTSETFSLCSFWACRVFNSFSQHQDQCHLRTRSPLWSQGSAGSFPEGIFEQSQGCV